MTDEEFIKACEQDAAENTQPEGTRIYDYGDRVCVVSRCERWAGYQHTRSGMCPRWEFTYHGRLLPLEILHTQPDPQDVKGVEQVSPVMKRQVGSLAGSARMKG
jgi:hypothetical protein